MEATVIGMFVLVTAGVGAFMLSLAWQAARLQDLPIVLLSAVTAGVAFTCSVMIVYGVIVY